MSILYSPESEYAKERTKWEAHHTALGPPGRPYTYQDYPVALSKATRPNEGGPPEFETRIAANEQEERNLNSRGFVRGRDKAVEALHAEQREFAKLAAEREREKHRLSAAAVAEVERIEDATSEHLPTIPEQPIQRRVKLTDEERRRRNNARAKAYQARKRAEKAQGA